MPVALFGLIEDVLLSGEERTLAPPALDPPTCRALARLVGTQAAFVTITGTHELPALVNGRHATLAEVVRAEGEGFVLRGERRVRISKAMNTEPPYSAEVDAPLPEQEDAGKVAAGIKALGDALAVTASEAMAEGGIDRLREAGAALLRAATPPEEYARLLRRPLAQTLMESAALVRGRAPAFAAEAKLESVAAALSPAQALSVAQRRRLWSRVVEVQKRLDLDDPTTHTADLDDLGKLERRLRQAGLPPEARDLVKRELRLVRGMDSKNNEMATYLGHLDLIARLSWHAAELPPPDLAKVQETLDREHAGMAKVKQRVCEYLAVRALGGTAQSTILCLVGPPGTGKTTIARSIATALSRPFVRVPLGGVHDECELRGFRPSFVAAGPGRVISALAQVGSQNALVLLDEIDKLGTDQSRSPTGALLELLDPEQHAHFQDNFLGTPYDLSHVLFVCTANDASRIHPVLLDRLEQVELDGYSIEEKVGLAVSHLLPRLVKESGLAAVPEVSGEVLRRIILGYTREPGLRQLQHKLAAILRGRALAQVKGGVAGRAPGAPITLDEVTEALGQGRTARKERDDILPVGTAYGLSVSADGGALLPIEVVRLEGKGKLHLTGRLGVVLRESARAVLAHLRHARIEYGIPEEALRDDLHVHLPDAATPKDGPSAGVALAVAMLSALLRVPVRPDVAFTGELTLGGRVLPVGGVRAKVLAAERAAMARVVVPDDNRPDLPEALRARPVLVTHLRQALDEAFRKDEPSDGATPLAAVAAVDAIASSGRDESNGGER